MKIKKLILRATPALALLYPMGLAAQSVSLSPTGTWASSEVELDGLGMEAIADAGQANADLYTSNYGDITTGNTLNRSNFIATMSQAFSGGYGGVYGFDESQGDYTSITFSLGSGGSASFSPGPNNYPEEPDYRGKHTSLFDGTGPSPNKFDEARPFNIGTSGTKRFIGDSFLGGGSSFDLDFDPTDEISVIGFAFLNYHNFQSFQQYNSDYPNSHARVVWTNGVDSITQMAVQFSAQDDDSDVYFGFQQPEEGYFLDSLAFYTIGNNGRAWVGADEMGIAVGDGVAVPEPTTSALFGGMAALLGVAYWRRRQRN